MKIYEDGIGEVVLIDSMGSDLRVVNAARVSYGGHSEELTEKDAKLIKYLYKEHHTSPFEHCMMTFRFVVPLFVRSQHHRHRTWKFSEVSRRYTPDNLQFYIPMDDWRTQSASSKQASVDGEFSEEQLDRFVTMATRTCIDALKTYNEYIDAGVAKEQARMILPQNLYTIYYATIDLKNAIDFLRLRLHPHAQKEIRLVAAAMKTYMEELFPETMKMVNFDYEV